MRFVSNSSEEIGVAFMQGLEEQFVDYMLDHFYHGVEVSEKKSILRQLKTMWILLNPVSSIADLV